MVKEKNRSLLDVIAYDDQKYRTIHEHEQRTTLVDWDDGTLPATAVANIVHLTLSSSNDAAFCRLLHTVDTSSPNVIKYSYRGSANSLV